MGAPPDRPDIVGNEFAEVSVRVDTGANSPRLRLEDLRSGRVRYLDALELETLVWLPEGHLRQLLDPSADRWRDDRPQPGP
jgi:hypothetical protein